MFKTNYIIPTSYLLLILILFVFGMMEPQLKDALALVPRNTGRVWGIVTCVFVHKDLLHLLSNTFALSVSMYGLFYFYGPLAARVTFISHFLTGLLVWLFARDAFHIGASGLAYALDLFILISGFIRRNRRLMVFAFVVLSLQSGLIWGMLPGEPGISWESHLFGGLSGALLAFVYRHSGPADDAPKVWDDEPEEGKDEYEELL